MHRQDIMNAAVSVFSEKGFYASTLDEIAQRAEFSKGALYLYFQNKEDILFSILLEPLETWLEANRRIMVGSQPFSEELRTLFEETAKYVFANPSLFALLNAQDAAFFKALSDDNRERLLSLKLMIENQLRTRIDMAVERQEIKPLAPEALISMIHGALHMTFSRWECSDITDHWECSDITELNKKINVYIDMVFNGIAF